MPRVALDLNKEEDRRKVKGQWRVGQGLVPGEPNEGLAAQLLNTPARLDDYDDSHWEVCADIRKSRSVGFTFAWYRITVEIPEKLKDVALTDSRVFFETNVDNYGEIWIDGKIDRAAGVISGINAQQRVEVSAKAVPGTKHVIACLAVTARWPNRAAASSCVTQRWRSSHVTEDKIYFWDCNEDQGFFQAAPFSAPLGWRMDHGGGSFQNAIPRASHSTPEF